MSITIDISPETLRRLEISAVIKGKAVKEVVEQIVERGIPKLSEAAAPIHEEFRSSGMTQEELDKFTDELIAEVRSETPLRSR